MADEHGKREVVGLIAGQGRLPFMVARGAKAAGLAVVCVGLRGQADPGLRGEVDRFGWGGVARPGRWIRFLRRGGACETIMVGRVAKKRIYTPWRIVQYCPDWRAFRVWYGRMRGRDRRNDTLLRALADELASGGIVLTDSTRYCREHLAGEGVLGRVEPGAAQRADIEFGLPIAREMGRLDVGQSIAVREREVIAVEAIEGTSRMIERVGPLCRVGGWTLIKVAKPGQDLRFDVPTVGPETLEKLKANGGTCLALEAGAVLIVEKEETLRLADRLGIAVVGVAQS